VVEAAILSAVKKSPESLLTANLRQYRLTPLARAIRRRAPIPERYDAIIVGGGHNGLTCGAYLARAGLRTVVLERRLVIGGAAVTEEIFPGFKF
jgi:heterodisulfide reductase subunit A-like polyferredoxin